jgi:hypothetical protein
VLKGDIHVRVSEGEGALVDLSRLETNQLESVRERRNDRKGEIGNKG